MNSIEHFSSGILLLLILGCGGPTETPKHENNIYKIVYAQGGCYGECPAESVMIDSSLAIKYYGVEFVDRLGYFQVGISQELWDEINLRCDSAKMTPTDSCIGSIDAQMIELHIYSKNGAQHFWGDRHCLPDSIVAICTWIEELTRNTLMSESYEFPIETHLQSPPPQIDSFQFTEPEIHQ